MKIEYIHFETLPSTNRWALDNLDTLTADKWYAISTDHQTEGYGQRGNHWITGKDTGITLSLVIPLEALPKNLGCYTLVLAHACVKYLKAHGIELQIKWPNDLFVNGKKLGGILGELREQHSFHRLVLGLGLNVNYSQEKLDGLDQPATSLNLIAPGKKWDLRTLEKDLVEGFKKGFELFQKEGFSPFKQELEKRLFRIGEEVIITQEHSEKQGKLNGLDPEGFLLLDQERILSGRIKLKS